MCIYRCTQSPSWPAHWMRICLCNRSITKMMEFWRESTVSHLVDTPSKIGCFLSPGTKRQRWRDCGIKHVQNNRLTLWLRKSTMVNSQCVTKMSKIINVTDRMWSNGWHINSQLFREHPILNSGDKELRIYFALRKYLNQQQLLQKKVVLCQHTAVAPVLGPVYSLDVHGVWE